MAEAFKCLAAPCGLQPKVMIMKMKRVHVLFFVFDRSCYTSMAKADAACQFGRKLCGM